MRLSVSQSSDESTIKVHGKRLDAAIAGDLRSGLIEALASIAGCAVIDVSEVEFIDSTALGAVIGALKTSRATVVLAGAQPPVRTVLRLTRIDRAIPVRDAVTP